MNSLNFPSHRTQLLLTALTASLATAGLFSLYTTYSRRERRRDLDKAVQQSIRDKDARATTVAENLHKKSEPTGNPEGGAEYDVQSEELIREQLARIYAFFGEESVEKIRTSNVVVVGCGGVGSWAAVMLVRS
jgi:hypothetical protein